MGQYHKIVNLDKREFIHPHRLGCGLKLWEQLANHPSTGTALIVLLASGSNGAGGGDLAEGPEIIGSWRGDRIAMVGDYDDETIYPVGPGMTGAQIYSACSNAFYDKEPSGWTDVSDAVCAVLEAELSGRFEGTGWRMFKESAA